MKLSSLQLAAFFETAKCKSFSRAAERLGITQSALSQRVANLEDDLQVTLLIRDPAGPLLTEAGERLLRYCQVNDSLEQEILGRLKSGAYSGMVRIAGFSSVLRSAIIPSLAPFLRAHPGVHCEFRSYEVNELADVLKNAEADFAILDDHLERSGVVEHALGREEYVVIESAKFECPENLYLDHGPHDNATEMFFRTQPGAPKNYQRSFMGDVYGIINGVELGLGRAVMSRHLLKGNNKVRIKKGYRRYFRDVTLNYFSQPYYSGLQRAVVDQLTENVPRYL
jgi:DNA-binding transcriptional LysR family regulator